MHALALVLATSGQGTGGPTTDAPLGQVEPLTVHVRTSVVRPGVQRIGINVGKHSPWGAAQILKNRITNPGFEPQSFASIWLTAPGSTDQRLRMAGWNARRTSDADGLGWPSGFWRNGRYEVLTGPAKGHSGRIARFRPEDERNVFVLEDTVPPPGTGDVVATQVLRRGYSREAHLPYVKADRSQRRPGSPGLQSLRLERTDRPSQAPWYAYMDTAWGGSWQSSGKLMLVRGDWRFEIWAKAATAGSRLNVTFRRGSEATFLRENFTVDPTWKKYTFDFHVPDGVDRQGPYAEGEPTPGLVLELFVPNHGEEIWVDDAYLARADEVNPTAFTDRFVDRLKELRPGVLRHLSRQFGGTLDNQIAAPYSRRSTGWHPAKRVAQHWDYSLHEFLELCREVEADPWYCIPPTWSPGELHGLVEYLAAPAQPGSPRAERRAALGQEAPWTDVFEKIHLEFSNEAWGGATPSDPFWGWSVGGASPLGEIGHDRFGILRASPHFLPGRFDLVLGANVNNPWTASRLEILSSNHDTIAVAPYFGTLERFADDEEIFQPLFARPTDDVGLGRMASVRDRLAASGQGTGIAIYELNYHTTRNADLPLDLRNAFVTCQAGAVALPLYALSYAKEVGAGPICPFTALEYSFGNGSRPVRLWGLLRDTEATGRKRPTWLGMELVNKAIQGNMVDTQHTGRLTGWLQEPMNRVKNPVHVEHVQSFAFRAGKRYSVVLFNLHLEETLQVRLDVPGIPRGSATMHTIANPDVYANNEEEQQVRMVTSSVSGFADGHVIDLPPHSVTALVWRVR